MGAGAALVTAREAAARVKGVHRRVRRLGGFDSRSGLLAAVPSEACRAVGLDRAVLSHVRDGVLRVAAVSYDHQPHKAARFLDDARSLRLSLCSCGPEQRAAITREPVLVPDPREAADALGPLVRQTRTRSYVIAPVVVGGVTVALLHGDRVAGARVDEFDAELLAVFGAGLAERLQAGDALPAPEGDAAVGAPGTLTRRERQIMELLAEGASNARIAERLVISEGTVKTHVCHILRKLDAANRTEAVGRYHAFAAVRRGLRQPDRA